MRTLKNFLMMGLMPIMALALMVGCQDTPEGPDQPTPPAVEKDCTIKLGKTSISTSLAGGSYLLEYTIQYNGEGENPHKNEKISAEAAESWVKDFNYAITGALQFTVEPNPTDAERECLVTVKYRFAEDVVFTVKQGAAVKAGFALENITATYFDYTVDIIPENKNLPYIVMSASPEYIIASGFETGQDYYEDDIAYFSWLGQFYGMSAAQVMQDRAMVGDQRGITVSGGASGVPYTFYCYYFDYESGSLLSDVTFFTVETAKPEKKEVDFNMTYEIVDGCMVKADVTPVGYTGDYYFDVLNSIQVQDYLDNMAFLNDEPRVVEYWWANAVQEMMKDMSNAEIVANFTCVGNNADGTPKSHYEFELLANHDYYLFAFAMEENGLCCSTPKVVKLTTGDVAMSNNEITPKVSKLTSRTATFSFTTTNDDYYVAGWQKASDWATYGSNDAERQEYLIHNMDYNLLSGNVSTSVIDLEPETDYVLYAFGSRGGVATTDKIFTETFRTKGLNGSVSIERVDRGYYDASDFADKAGYEYLSNYAGKAIFPIEVKFSDENHGDYFFETYNWTNRAESEYYNDQQYIDGLVWSINEYGSATATHTYTFLDFGGKYEFVAIVFDADGQMSKLYREWIEPNYDGCGDADDYVAWWDAYQQSQNEGPNLSSIVYNEVAADKFFSEKSPKAQRVSEMTFSNETVKMASDEILAR
ncbi:MAG: hypothetical protein IKY20_08300 [Alistipes sp.]|nr:hypothetical protein [Alistipes sp.]